MLVAYKRLLGECLHCRLLRVGMRARGPAPAYCLFFAEKAGAEFEQIARIQFAVAVLIEHGGQQAADHAALGLLAAGLFVQHRSHGLRCLGLALRHLLGQEIHHNRRQNDQQFLNACRTDATGLAQAVLGFAQIAAKQAVQNCARIETSASIAAGIGTDCTNNRAQQAAPIEAACARSAWCSLRAGALAAHQCTQQRLCAAATLEVFAQSRQQQRHGRANGALGLLRIRAHLLCDLTHADTTQLVDDLFCNGRIDHKLPFLGIEDVFTECEF